MTPDQQEISKHRSEVSKPVSWFQYTENKLLGNSSACSYIRPPSVSIAKLSLTTVQMLGWSRSNQNEQSSHCDSNVRWLRPVMNYEILLDGPHPKSDLQRWEGYYRFNFLASALCSDSQSRVRIKGPQQNLMVHKYQLATDLLWGSNKCGKVWIYQGRKMITIHICKTHLVSLTLHNLS